jgi:hypothetical protein
VIVAAALAMLVAVAPTPAVDTLVVTSVDASAYPKVVVDFVLPERLAAVEVTPAMVTLDGAPVAAVAPVDPTGVVVSLVVDDGPAVPAEVVGASQGGATELVRNIDAGTRIAVATPSGLQTAFTADPAATIAGIAGIVAGAPAVTPLPQLILDAAAALGTADTHDRHLVVVLGGPLGASEAQLFRLAILVASDGITLHLVSAAGAVEPALIPIAEQSGGSVPIAGETLASFDAITAAISDRYRVTTTVGTPGEHMLALTMNGETIQAVVTVSRATPAASTPTTPTTVLASSPPVPSATTVADGKVPNDVGANTTLTTVEAVAGNGATAPPDDNTSPLTVVAIALMALLIAVAFGYFVLTRFLPRAVEIVEELAEFSAYPEIESNSIREAIPDVVPDPDSGPMTELEISPEPEPAPESAPESEPAPDPEPEPELASATDPEPEPKLVSATDPAPESELVSATDPAPESELESEPAPAPESESESELESEPAPDPEPEPELASATDPAPESELESEPAPDPEPEPELELVSATEPAPDPEPESELESELESESAPDPDPAPELASANEPQPAPELASANEPQPELASANDPDSVAAPEPRRARKAPVSSSSVVASRRTARPTPAHLTRGGGRSEPNPAPVVADPSAGPEWLVSGFLRFCPASGEVWSGRIQVHLDPQELAILQLLMTSGNRGVTRDDIIQAGNLDPAGRDFAPLLARIKGKTGWRGQMVRRESVTVYVFDDDVEIDDQKSVSRRPARPPARR